MKKLMSIALFASALVLGGPGAPARADNTIGVCDMIIATVLGPAYQRVNGIGDPVAECQEIGGALFTFANTDGCIQEAIDGHLGLAHSHPAGPEALELTPLGKTLCGALCSCGLFPAVEGTLCVKFTCD